MADASTEIVTVSVTGAQEDVESFARELQYLPAARSVRLESRARGTGFFDDDVLGHGELVDALITIATTAATVLTEEAVRGAYRSYTSRGSRLALDRVERGTPAPDAETGTASWGSDDGR